MGPAGPRFSVPVVIQVSIPFPRGARRDPHNYTGTVVKAVVDGLVLAGAIPDDSQKWATVMDPELVVDPTGTVTVTVTERPPA